MNRLSTGAAALALAVALVLADSSIVVLALPDILVQLDVTVEQVAWVLTGFNLALALVAVPAAYAARRAPPGRACAAGLALFAVACLACAVAPSYEVLIAARVGQALGGALAVCAALELLPAHVGSEGRAAAVWTAAGAIGAALGPALGGVLTEAFSWRAVFAVQVPLSLIPLVGLLRAGALDRPARASAGRPHLAANVALGLVSAALTAALFLLVLLLIEGWKLSPMAAALTVSVIPVAALATSRATDRLGSAASRAAAGAIAIGGGLAALAFLPDAEVAWTIVPQAFVGAGLALTISALTERALAGRSPQAIHGGWTIAARHAGVFVGLVILTPLFTADLESEEAKAQAVGADIVLESRLPVQEKLELGGQLALEVQSTQASVPDFAPVFRRAAQDGGDRAALGRIEERLEGQVVRAATHAFSRSFLVAAALALAALVPILVARRRLAL
jgi:predicted MFS family arabinose efflux permease